MRVALVLATSTGGIGRHVFSLAEALAAGGDRVAVLGGPATERLFGFTSTGAVFAPVELRGGPSNARAVAQVRRLTRGADVVHAHGLRAGMVAGLALTGRDTPLVVTWHNRVLLSGMRARAALPLESLVARYADVTLGASADLVDRAKSLGAHDVRLGPVAAPPLPPPVRSSAEIRAELGLGGELIVLAVGRLHPQKGYDVLIRAADRWSGITVLIAGEGPLEHQLSEQIEAADAPVLLLGRRTDIADLLGAADLVVLPSHWEARSLVAQETLRAGKPLVTTTVGGLPGLVGDAARLVPPDDSDALAEAVLELLDDPDAAAKLGARGRERAATFPTEADTVAQVRAIYAELTAAT
jgi:glycosyltransferase involved in cell wall biosynthesis